MHENASQPFLDYFSASKRLVTIDVSSGSEAGIWDKAWGRLLRRLDQVGDINREESFADGTFSSAKKGVNA